ncbi:hypothetical protein BCR33DRAFT_857216 [Rhizoclosmatium globosum]|uniref:F-box domain-containing protein n=1 Tax=Rhizoclosmatium globosum TaxID=329046 RepID=A0A1Y2B821_9FUNG|nr:hypothetical protein BCR33DRAFT_857216 [Rhizoclosmatium globosum]|eukprot:ORY30972.1 hypothetical protein BCR33DRAFT_857216 [Rhizoclosmatium globosum]
MPRARKRLTTSSSSEGLPATDSLSFCGLPTELVEEVFGYLKPVDVLNLGYVNRRLASLTRADSRIWTIHFQLAALPALPESAAGIITHKQVLILLSRVGCVNCPAKTKLVNWRILKQVCSKCKRLVNLPDPVADEEFPLWVQRMVKFENSSEYERRLQLCAIQRQRRIDIISRFAAMNPPISIDILQQCEDFEKTWKPAVPLTNRIFANITHSLGPQIKAVRIKQCKREWYLRLHVAAMEGIPEIWSNYMNMERFYNDDSLHSATSRGERAFIRRFFTTITEQLNNYHWNQAFPDFDTTPYLEEARRVLHRPYEKFEASRVELVSRLPHLDAIINEFLESRKYRASLQYLYRHREYEEGNLENYVKSKVLESRFDAVFPRFRINIEDYPTIQINRLGGMEWYNRNVDAFDYTKDAWDEEVIKASWREWDNAINSRVASVYRNIIEKCNPDLLLNEPDKFNGELEDLIFHLQQSPEWPLLSDLNPTAICVVKQMLVGIRRVSDMHTGQDPDSDFHDTWRSRRNIQALLTALPANYNEGKLWDACSRYFNQEYISHYYYYYGTIQEKFYESIGLDFTTGFTHDPEDLIDWYFGQTRDDYNAGSFESQLLCEMEGFYSIQSDWANPRSLLNDVVPSNDEFDATECVEKHMDYLNVIADQFIEEVVDEVPPVNIHISFGCVLM